MIFKFAHTEIDKALIKVADFIGDNKGSYTIEVVKSKSKRSLSQNAYYWGVVIKIMSDDTGFTPDEMHQALKHQFLLYFKEGKAFTKSTKSLDTKEFEKYAEQCRMFGSENLGLVIPLPNEVTEEMWIQLRKD